ncbi:2,3-diaminopropionate biosynthesis protein SbnB [Streptomyces sp. SAI-144]|uniref:2,3-diaminopropionate biosynthesis protein SbnB n=1 Tax=unclassified Streptomyces TaxID=2593676 RepID=UPI002473A79F|nr:MULTISPECIES: 2,3-diaminopropionate biosynthesis protein SbnB [unclassified Streptomyces]MDH6438065.1 2,3-diaminopropionate biosynthesis protein SbnB [Streptomyces sp. SAI-144]MDH6485484.1 2,3-diaminopropionate biosynthesis protein SbnB [Streptomyces sp. SAI-127]
MFDFHVVGGTALRALIDVSRPEIVETVRSAYLTHDAGDSVNPNSYFLRFPQKPDARIIALPAHLGGDYGLSGIKWIASYPRNIERNIPRASATLLLNDYETGYPFACLEASQISSARTAASAVLGAEELTGGRTAQRICLVGAGVIARNIAEFFAAQSWSVDRFVVHDREASYAAALTRRITDLGYRAEQEDSFERAAADADLVVFATTSSEPWVTRADTFAPGQTVLNISLRDLGWEIVADAQNILDDVDHCLTADTSPHLAEQRLGHRDFIDGTLAQVLRGKVAPAADRPRIFSPFGLGVLDLAVGQRLHRQAVEKGLAVGVPDFFGETQRWS